MPMPTLWAMTRHWLAAFLFVGWRKEEGLGRRSIIRCGRQRPLAFGNLVWPWCVASFGHE